VSKHAGPHVTSLTMRSATGSSGVGTPPTPGGPSKEDGIGRGEKKRSSLEIGGIFGENGKDGTRDGQRGEIERVGRLSHLDHRTLCREKKKRDWGEQLDPNRTFNQMEQRERGGEGGSQEKTSADNKTCSRTHQNRWPELFGGTRKQNGKRGDGSSGRLSAIFRERG